MLAVHPNHHSTALHFAARGVQQEEEDQAKIVAALACAQVGINGALRPGKQTPLHVACLNLASPAKAVRALLVAGGKVNATDREGNTPLHLACRVGLVGVVKLLLLYEANEKMVNKAKKKPAGMLCTNQQAILDLLARAPAYRAWRRRGWVVIFRAKAKAEAEAAGETGTVDLVKQASKTTRKINAGGESGGHVDSGRGGGGNKEMDDLAHLVGRLVDIEEDDIFRSVMKYL